MVDVKNGVERSTYEHDQQNEWHNNECRNQSEGRC